MKTDILVSVLAVILLLGCDSNNSKLTDEKANDKAQIDSLKWLYYAYSFDGYAEFKKDNIRYRFNPTKCDIQVDSVHKFNKDSMMVLFRFHMPGYILSHFDSRISALGFTLKNNVAIPITGMISYDNFNNINYMASNNMKTDSSFREFLKNTDTTKLSAWLLKEGRRRKVWDQF